MRDSVPVFTYGTLRYGEGNYHWCSPAVIGYAQNVLASGQIYFVGKNKKGFPVAKFDERGWILGDILWFDPDHPLYTRMVEMEVGAGYEVRNIPVRIADGEWYQCKAFHFIGTPRGELISSGDWISESLRG